MLRVIFCLAVFINSLMGSIAQADDNQSTEQQLRALQTEMAALQQRLDDELGNRDQMLASLAATERQISDAKQRIDKARQSANDLTTSLKALEMQSQTLTEQTAQSLAELTELLLKGFPLTRQSTLKLLLNQQNPNKARRLLHYHQILSRHSANTIKTLTEKITQLTQTQQAIEDELEVLSELEHTQAQALARLEKLNDERTQTLAQLNARIDTEQQRLAQLKQDQERLAQILEVATRLPTAPPLDDEPPSLIELKGQLPMPVRGIPVKRFGQPREGETNWRGWLMETQAEAFVHAIGAGRVVYADWLRGYGLLIIIDHTDQLLSLYAHNEQLFVEVGDWVRAGTAIGTAARPGSAPLMNHPGMYFELRHNGQPTNPAPWIDQNKLP